MHFNPSVMHAARLVPAILLFSATTLLAQVTAPLASLPGDTVARLALDPERAGGAEFLGLLDELTVTVEPDGRSSRTYRNVVQVLTTRAATSAAERQFNWQPGRQSFSLDWVRVLKPDGTVLSNAPSADQSGDATPSLQNPIYVDNRMRRISLASIAPNTIVDVQYTVIDSAPWRVGDFLVAWNFSPPAPLRMSRLSVSVPAGFTPHIEERNLAFRRAESDAAGRHVYEWQANAPSLIRREPFAADTDGVRMSVTVSAPEPWDSVAHWYDRLAAPRTVLNAASAARMDSVVRNARSRADTLKALHKWIAQEVRYVSVSLGLGGYQPRSPADVLLTGYGDCKDKTTLFVAAARRWGIRAYPVLLHLNGTAAAQPVSIGRFNHAIAAIAEPTGGYTFTDLTAATVPYGSLPSSYAGSLGVLVRENGRAETVHFPVAPVAASGATARFTATLSANGSMDMVVEETPRGQNEWAMRSAFAQPLDSTRRAASLRAMAEQYLPESTADSLQLFDGLDFSAEPKFRLSLRGGRGARAAGPVWLLHIPAGFRQLAAGASNTARELAAQPKRSLPIDVDKVIGRRLMQAEYRITLPEGWTAQLPSPVSTSSFAGRYESSYRQEGRELILTRMVTGSDAGVQPPERVVELVTWMQSVARDDHEFITLTPPA